MRAKKRNKGVPIVRKTGPIGYVCAGAVKTSLKINVHSFLDTPSYADALGALA